MASYKSFLKKIDACIPELKGNEILHSCKTKNELRVKLKEYSDELGKKWLNSERTDFSIYNSDEYLLECIWCYLIASYLSVHQFGHFCKKFGIQPDASIIDVHNGLGFTTEYIYGLGFKNISVFNTVENQISSCRNLCKYSHGLEPTFYKDLPENKFDIVISLETFEHFEDPFPFVKRMMDLSGNYIVETASYNSPECYGHYETYYKNGIPLTGRQVKNEVKKLLKTEFELVFSGFNSHPSVWKRKIT